MIQPLQRDDELLQDIHAAGGDALHLWWLGQSGFLFKHDNSFLLIDPYLSDALTRKYAATDKPHVRMTERCIEPEHLRFVKLVCSSHQHTDHFDEATLTAMNGGMKLVVGSAVEQAARQRLGDTTIQLVTIDDGVSIDLDGWTITGLAAAHNHVERDEHGRAIFLSFMLRREGFTVFHSGDTLWHDALVPALLPLRCDLMLLPINGNKPGRRVAGNLNGTEAAALARACEAKLVVPHHFEMFEFNTETPEEFTRACDRLGQPHQVLRCGERLTLSPVSRG